jgi:hypothetical protein
MAPTCRPSIVLPLVKGTIMQNPIEIENIEALRRQQGIDDVELHQEIRGLRVGNIVKLTVSTGTPFPGQALLVRITRIHGLAFRGKVVQGPSNAGLGSLRVGAVLAFTADQIHSIPRLQPCRSK